MPIVMLPDPNKVYDSDAVIDAARSSSDTREPAPEAPQTPNEAASAQGPLEAPTKQGPRPCSSEHGVPNRRRNEKDNARRDTRSKRCSCACPAFADPDRRCRRGRPAPARPRRHDKAGGLACRSPQRQRPLGHRLGLLKITGAVNDEGGGPTWTDEASYTAPNSMTTGGQAAAAKRYAASDRPAASVLAGPRTGPVRLVVHGDAERPER